MGLREQARAARKKKEPEPRGWIVRMKVTKYVDVVCDDCTEEQARAEPFEHAVEEMDQETLDWEVQSVRPND